MSRFPRKAVHVAIPVLIAAGSVPSFIVFHPARTCVMKADACALRSDGQQVQVPATLYVARSATHGAR